MDVPSPQCVGQEFVRQYYTMLHKAPEFMHRFYSHDSSFVHGGIEKPGEELPPIRGQMEIHKKILSLNFKDCHAKIRQVDSQATVDHAVVVQVAGELSNNGLPMRRFMQTFVLAPQSPKKYYVYNDIFRYQDEVFHDDLDAEPETIDSFSVARSTAAAAAPVSTAGVDADLVNNKSAAIAHMPDLVPPPVISGEENIVAVREAAAPASQPQLSTDTAAAAADALSALQLSTAVDAASESLGAQQQQAARAASPRPSSGLSASQATVSPAVRSAGPASPRPQELGQDQIYTQQQQRGAGEAAKPTAVGTMSWAALAAGKNSGGGTTVPAAPAPTAAPVTPTSKPQATVKPELKPDVSINNNNNSTTINNTTQPRGGPRPVERGSMERDLVVGGSTGGGLIGGSSEFEDGSRRPIYPDEQQLFVGNLPHATSNEELKEFFNQYGAVLDVRINRKGPSRDVPNFGFVTFESTESVQKVLANKPLYLGNKHRLNVEEKKPPADLVGGPGGPRGPAGRGGEGPQRGGFKSYPPSGGRGGGSGGVVSFRGGRGTWRGRPRGGGPYRGGNSDDNGSGGESPSDVYNNQN